MWFLLKRAEEEAASRKPGSFYISVYRECYAFHKSQIQLQNSKAVKISSEEGLMFNQKVANFIKIFIPLLQQ